MAQEKLRFLLQLSDDVDLALSEGKLKDISGQIDEVEDKGNNAGKGWFEPVEGKVPTMKSALGGLATVAAGVFSVSAIAGYFQYLQEIEKEYTTIRGTLQQIGNIQGGQIDQQTVQLQTLSRTFGADQKEMLEVANNLAKAYGTDLGTAMDLVEKGFLSGADLSGEMLNILREYPKLMREAGIEQEQFVALTARQAKMGVYDDKGIDALKEGLLSLREMTKPTREALAGLGLDADTLKQKYGNDFSGMMEEVSERMAKIPPQSEAMGAALADIFKGAGEDAGLDWILSLKDLSGSLDDLIDPTNELTAAQQKQMAIQEDLAIAENELTKATNGRATSLGNLWTIAKTKFLETNTAIGRSGDLFDVLTEGIDNNTEAGRENAENLLSWADAWTRLTTDLDRVPGYLREIGEATEMVNAQIAQFEAGGASALEARHGAIARAEQMMAQARASGDVNAMSTAQMVLDQAREELRAELANPLLSAATGFGIDNTSTTGTGGITGGTGGNQSGINKITKAAQQQRSVITNFNAPVFAQGSVTISSQNLELGAKELMDKFEEFVFRAVNNADQTL